MPCRNIFLRVFVFVVLNLLFSDALFDLVRIESKENHKLLFVFWSSNQLPPDFVFEFYMKF